MGTQSAEYISLFQYSEWAPPFYSLIRRDLPFIRIVGERVWMREGYACRVGNRAYNSLNGLGPSYGIG